MRNTAAIVRCWAGVNGAASAMCYNPVADRKGVSMKSLVAVVSIAAVVILAGACGSDGGEPNATPPPGATREARRV